MSSWPISASRGEPQGELAWFLRVRSAHWIKLIEITLTDSTASHWAMVNSQSTYRYTLTLTKRAHAKIKMERSGVLYLTSWLSDYWSTNVELLCSKYFIWVWLIGLLVSSLSDQCFVLSFICISFLSFSDTFLFHNIFKIWPCTSSLPASCSVFLLLILYLQHQLSHLVLFLQLLAVWYGPMVEEAQHAVLLQGFLVVLVIDI